MKQRSIIPLLSAGLLLGTAGAALATEGGGSIYLPGLKGPLAGTTPPPGLFLQNDFYFYEGDAGANAQLPFGGELLLGADMQIILDLPTAVWITEQEIAGGRLGFALSVPILNVGLGATLNALDFNDDLTAIADPVLSALIGWDAGNFHYQTGVSINVPIGYYDDGAVLNVSRHYWGADFYGSVTWLDPGIGLDLSSSVGIVVNAENPATDYRSGTEFHWDWAAVQHFNEQFSAGLVGYYYQQITGDSGSGAVGDFKGRVFGIGAMIGYNFQLGDIPVSTSLRYYHEFEAENRFEGDGLFFTAAIPLWMPK